MSSLHLARRKAFTVAALVQLPLPCRSARGGGQDADCSALPTAKSNGQKEEAEAWVLFFLLSSILIPVK